MTTLRQAYWRQVRKRPLILFWSFAEWLLDLWCAVRGHPQVHSKICREYYTGEYQGWRSWCECGARSEQGDGSEETKP